MSDYSWTQPLCGLCWEADHPDGRIPYRVRPASDEICCRCGNTTKSGIYVRVNPKTVPHPS